MQFFFIPDISKNHLYLDETESKHCVRVLRLGRGSVIQLVDGKGGLYDAEIVEPDVKKCRLKILYSVHDFGKKHFYLHLAIAPTKNMDRFEWFAEKATEIGIDEITPLVCENSERKTLKTDRIEKILIAAMKQSLKAFLPKINEPCSFKDFIDRPFSGNRYIAHCLTGKREHLYKVIRKKEKILILVGPEGDFSVNEIKTALKAGFTEVSLGQNRLRTETAGIVVCQIVNMIFDQLFNIE